MVVLDPFKKGFFLEKWIGEARYHDFRLFLIRFIIFGLLGYNVEVIFTSLHSFVDVLRESGWPLHLGEALQAKTGLLAFFIYCWAAIPFTYISKPFQKLLPDHFFKPIPHLGNWTRGLVYGLIFMAIEFVTGLIAWGISGWSVLPWEYTHIPLNVLGIITFTFLPFWTFAGALGE